MTMTWSERSLFWLRRAESRALVSKSWPVPPANQTSRAGRAHAIFRWHEQLVGLSQPMKVSNVPNLTWMPLPLGTRKCGAASSFSAESFNDFDNSPGTKG
jgi:hypothetical protein